MTGGAKAGVGLDVRLSHLLDGASAPLIWRTQAFLGGTEDGRRGSTSANLTPEGRAGSTAPVLTPPRRWQRDGWTENEVSRGRLRGDNRPLPRGRSKVPTQWADTV